MPCRQRRRLVLLMPLLVALPAGAAPALPVEAGGHPVAGPDTARRVLPAQSAPDAPPRPPAPPAPPPRCTPPAPPTS